MDRPAAAQPNSLLRNGLPPQRGGSPRRPDSRVATAALFALLGLGLAAAPSSATLPEVSVLTPNGGEVLQAGVEFEVTWSATDDVAVTAVDIDYRDAETALWTPVAAGLPNTGSYGWFVHNTPTVTARVRVVAHDAEGSSEDASDGVFTILQVPGGFVATTLRDFHEPGSQPFAATGLQSVSFCRACHGGFDFDVEPSFNYDGSMMAQAARDPLFYACLAVAEQDAPSSGDLCLRCHTPPGWLAGRSNPTDASALLVSDRDGVSCDFCHSLVDPQYKDGISPPADLPVLSQLQEIPSGYGEGQYVVDPNPVRRGPYNDPMTPHSWLQSPFHKTGDLCGTCHNVSNPVFTRTAGADYQPGPLDDAADSLSAEILFPLERTYSEWRHSEFNTPGGVYAPDFAGAKPDGIVSTCEDCHMRDVVGQGCGSEYAPIRLDLPLHDFTGGNTWVPGLVKQLYPDEVIGISLDATPDRARRMLRLAALVDVQVAPEADSFRAEVTVTNRTGHKLLTGYPEGRRMWIQLEAFDQMGGRIYESGAYDAGTGVLAPDPDLRVYESREGISTGLAGETGLEPGPSFHFVLNDTVYKDNRIPPLGFTNAAFDSFGGTPVDPDFGGPGPRYPDGQNWDVATYPLPPSTRTVVTRLLYQTTSKEYVEFLRDENTTNGAGQLLYDLWADNGRAAPETMFADTLNLFPTDVPVPAEAPVLRFSTGPNPTRGEVVLRLELPRPEQVRIEVFDLQGRRRATIDGGMLSAGPHRLTWDGLDERGRDAGSGIFWIRARAGEESLVRRVVRLR